MHATGTLCTRSSNMAHVGTILTTAARNPRAAAPPPRRAAAGRGRPGGGAVGALLVWRATAPSWCGVHTQAPPPPAAPACWQLRRQRERTRLHDAGGSVGRDGV
jgi:hypothetical protein